MTEPRTIEQHGSRIIAALERAWAAIQDQHPDVPDVVIVTGAGSNQKGTPEGYRRGCGKRIGDERLTTICIRVHTNSEAGAAHSPRPCSGQNTCSTVRGKGRHK